MRSQSIPVTISITTEQLAEALASAGIRDRYSDMVDRYGEACTKATAARLVSCSVRTIDAMIEDGRILTACEGSRVDVRSLVDYIERRQEANHEARMRRKGMKNYV